jgi:hypothetical protein
MDPQDLQQAMRLARAYERRNAAHAPASTGQRPARRPPGTQATLPAPTGSTTTSSTPTRLFKQLTPEEMADQCKMGLCYNCDEPYVRGHKCACQFFLEATDYVVEESKDDTEPVDASFDPEKPMISLAAITGIRVEKTMQLPVQIGMHKFTALLDSGSTHNFIDVNAARRAGLQVDDCPGTHVVVANGDHVACRGLNRAIPLQIGDTSFAVDCFAIPLPHYDMVLRISWLRTLGPIFWDFNGLHMAFVLRGRRMLWTGVGSPNAQCAEPLLESAIYTDKGAEPALLE